MSPQIRRRHRVDVTLDILVVPSARLESEDGGDVSSALAGGERCLILSAAKCHTNPLVEKQCSVRSDYGERFPRRFAVTPGLRIASP